MQKHSCYLAQEIHRSVQFTFSHLQVGVPVLNFLQIKVSLANRTLYSLACNSVGTAPGCMLLEEEYSLGSRLSRVHRRHSDVLELIFIPGNVSMQVEQVGI